MLYTPYNICMANLHVATQTTSEIPSCFLCHPGHLDYKYIYAYCHLNGNGFVPTNGLGKYRFSNTKLICTNCIEDPTNTLPCTICKKQIELKHVYHPTTEMTIDTKTGNYTFNYTPMCLSCMYQWLSINKSIKPLWDRRHEDHCDRFRYTFFKTK